MVIEYLDGADLSQLISARGRFTQTEAVDWILQALEGLAQAHCIGVIHRDLKPENLFITRRGDGSALVKVLDFGISKASVRDPSIPGLTAANEILGTPTYASPEQLQDSQDVDERTDVWSIGVVLFELLSGSVPFGGETPADQICAILSKPPASLRSQCPDIDPLLDAVVMKCLSAERADRFENVADLADALAPHGSTSADALAAQIRTTFSFCLLDSISENAQPTPLGFSPRAAFVSTRGRRGPRTTFAARIGALWGRWKASASALAAYGTTLCVKWRRVATPVAPYGLALLVLGLDFGAGESEAARSSPGPVSNLPTEAAGVDPVADDRPEDAPSPQAFEAPQPAGETIDTFGAVPTPTVPALKPPQSVHAVWRLPAAASPNSRPRHAVPVITSPKTPPPRLPSLEDVLGGRH
jgi:serine/threonine-protein kinase